MGPLRYDLSINFEILKIGCRKPAPCTLEVDGAATSLDLFVLTVMNNKRTGVGLRVSPYAQMDDGKIDLMYTPAPVRSIAQCARLQAGIKGGGKHVNDAKVAYKTAAKEVKLTSHGTPKKIMCDGDIIGETPLTMTVLPASITVLTPAESPPC